MNVLNNRVNEIGLDENYIKKVVPSIFAQSEHESRSDRYAFIPTIEVLRGLKKEGFVPFKVSQTNSKKQIEHTKHMVRLRHVNDLGGRNGEVNEIVMINSHNGSSCYKMMAGIFRFVCSNGMIVGDVYDSISVRHTGDVVDDVIDASYRIVEDFQEINSDINEMKSIELSDNEKYAFAKASIGLKWDEEEEFPIDVEQLLLPKRYNDDRSDIWTTFNTVQENLIKGGQDYTTKNNRRMRTRGVKNIDKDVKMNKALWILADEMARLKTM